MRGRLGAEVSAGLAAASKARELALALDTEKVIHSQTQRGSRTSVAESGEEPGEFLGPASRPQGGGVPSAEQALPGSLIYFISRNTFL